ncbi:uroporphyrinogen-III synthase [Sinobaca qinghaiensis]|uniref:Uroporphyrinogen-III synthase n=1 Tax=Sinobaca qinghaiensis TaxID=342944 RepID=A0A419V736_9BACL|nr:uroporphyrinogen-III synthase [Sinobaca qinghaiensis]RKD75677.1 uroporphyrinogen-III synthase [Sinobaca qinghaiensis]
MSLSLNGSRILITRPSHQSSLLAQPIERSGGRPVVIPLIGVERLPLSADDREKIKKMYMYEWFVFTSVNAVHYFMETLKQEGHSFPSHAKIAAVGSKTARSLTDAGLSVELMPESYTAEALSETLASSLKKGSRILFPKSRISRDTITARLQAEEKPVDAIDVYTTAPVTGNIEPLQHVILHNEIDFITFTSPSAVRAFLDGVSGLPLENWSPIPVISIGPVTSAEAEKHAFKQIYTADPHTIEGMMDLLLKLSKEDFDE